MSDGTAEASLEMREKGTLACSHLTQAELCLRPHRLSSSKVSWPLASLCLRYQVVKILGVGLPWWSKG